MCSARTSVSCSANRARRGAILLFLIASFSAAAQNRALSLEFADPGEIRTDSRQVVSSGLVCGNAGPKQLTVELAASLPEGWKPVGGQGRFTLPAGGMEIRIVSFLVPAGARAGTYDIRYRLRDAGGIEPAAEGGVAVTVLPRVGIGLQVLEQPPFTLAGDDYEIRFLLANTGNTDTRVDLSVQTDSSFPFETPDMDDLLDLAMPAGGSTELRFLVHTSKDLLQSARNPFMLSARIHESADAAPAAAAASIVEVIPVSSDTGSLMHTIPLTSETLGSVTFSDGVRAELQETLKAEGSLDELGEHRVELLLSKQIGTDTDPLINREDRYSIRYSYDFLDVRLGDHLFGVSPLILMDEYGRGAQAGITLGPVGASTFIFKDFWAASVVQGLGGNIQYTLPASGQGDEYLYRAGLGAFSPLTDRTLIGLWQLFNPIEGVKLELDAALDINGADSPSPAVLAVAQGQHLDKTLSWNARYLRAWPDFDGAFHDAQLVAVGFGIKLLDNLLRFQGSAALTDNNLLLDPARVSAERLLSFTAGAAGTLPDWGTDASLQWTTRYREDLLTPPDFHSIENSASLSVQQPLDPVDLRLSSTVSAAFDELTQTTVWFQKLVAAAGYDVSESAHLDGSLAYSRRQTAEQTASNALGLSMDARFDFPRTRAEAGLRNEWSFSTTGLVGILADINGKITYLFPWGHTLTGEGNFSLTLDSDALTPAGSLSLLYSVPMDVPVSRKRDAIAVRGTLTRQETGAPEPGVVLRLNGAASITGNDGGFSFFSSTPGSHYLSFDPRTLGLGVVPAQTMPIEVVSPPGSEIRLDLGLVEGCAVSGTVVIYGYPSETEVFVNDESAETASPQLRRMSGLGGQIVELTDGMERKRRVTGADGRFVFEQIRPGAWRLEVIPGELPSYHSVEQKTLTFELAPGERREVEFRVVQEQRRIQMIDLTGSTVIESASATAGDRIITIGNGETGNNATPKPAADSTAARVPPYLDPAITKAKPTAAAAPVPYPPYSGPSYKTKATVR
jgi:hypothetical protein